jgi:hypothetical protein
MIAVSSEVQRGGDLQGTGTECGGRWKRTWRRSGAAKGGGWRPTGTGIRRSSILTDNPALRPSRRVRLLATNGRSSWVRAPGTNGSSPAARAWCAGRRFRQGRPGGATRKPVVSRARPAHPRSPVAAPEHTPRIPRTRPTVRGPTIPGIREASVVTAPRTPNCGASRHPHRSHTARMFRPTRGSPVATARRKQERPRVHRRLRARTARRRRSTCQRPSRESVLPGLPPLLRPGPGFGEAPANPPRSVRSRRR